MEHRKRQKTKEKMKKTKAVDRQAGRQTLLLRRVPTAFPVTTMLAWALPTARQPSTKTFERASCAHSNRTQISVVHATSHREVGQAYGCVRIQSAMRASICM